MLLPNFISEITGSNILMLILVLSQITDKQVSTLTKELKNCTSCQMTNKWPREVVVAQLVERSLPIPEVRGLNPVIGKNLFLKNICLLTTVYWKDENKEKEAGNGPSGRNLVGADVPLDHVGPLWFHKLFWRIWNIWDNLELFRWPDY